MSPGGRFVSARPAPLGWIALGGERREETSVILSVHRFNPITEGDDEGEEKTERKEKEEGAEGGRNEMILNFLDPGASFCFPADGMHPVVWKSPLVQCGGLLTACSCLSQDEG